MIAKTAPPTMNAAPSGSVAKVPRTASAPAFLMMVKVSPKGRGVIRVDDEGGAAEVDGVDGSSHIELAVGQTTMVSTAAPASRTSRLPFFGARRSVPESRESMCQIVRSDDGRITKIIRSVVGGGHDLVEDCGHCLGSQANER